MISKENYKVIVELQFSLLQDNSVGNFFKQTTKYLNTFSTDADLQTSVEAYSLVHKILQCRIDVFDNIYDFDSRVNYISREVCEVCGKIEEDFVQSYMKSMYRADLLDKTKKISVVVG